MKAVSNMIIFVALSTLQCHGLDRKEPTESNFKNGIFYRDSKFATISKESEMQGRKRQGKQQTYKSSGMSVVASEYEGG